MNMCNFFGPISGFQMKAVVCAGRRYWTIAVTAMPSR